MKCKVLRSTLKGAVHELLWDDVGGLGIQILAL